MSESLMTPKQLWAWQRTEGTHHDFDRLGPNAQAQFHAMAAALSPVEKFPTPTSARDWALLDCWGSFAVIFVLSFHDGIPDWQEMVIGALLWWAMVYWQWSAKLRTLDDRLKAWLRNGEHWWQRWP